MTTRFFRVFGRFASMMAAIIVLAFAACAQKDLSIAAVQGRSDESPYAGQSVRVKGIVTAVIRSGFFIQTPDDAVDADPQTSEGILIYTKDPPSADAAIGNEVSVVGRVAEYRPASDIASLTITEISHFTGKDELKVLSRSNKLPAAHQLSFKDLDANAVDQLEPFEGMRVELKEATVVGPTGGRLNTKTETVTSDGTFFVVLKGTPRPMREPGVDIRVLNASKQNQAWKAASPRLPVFDSNPEVIRVDSSEQVAASADGKPRTSKPVEVASKAELTGLSGVMHYGYGKYTLLTDAGSPLAVSGIIRPIPMPDPTDRQFVIASSNIESFFDDVDDPGIKEEVVTPEAFQKRLAKVSIAVRDYLKLPDVLAVVEIEGMAALRKLADKINKDVVTAGKPDPKYQAYIFEGNDGRGIDCGFLIKTSRVKVISAEQIGKKEKYENPVTKSDDFLNDRTPVAVTLSIDEPKTGRPVIFTVVANHLKSYRGVDDPKDGPNVRMKKKLQAEFLAKWVASRRKAKPGEPLLLVGDFNAFQFSDGLVDVVGTIKGTPAPKDAVVLGSDDLLDPDLTDFVDLIKVDQQYSYVFDGNAQALDHFIGNAEMKKLLTGFGFLRVNADFPAILRADATRVERFSDHDIAVGYFDLSKAGGDAGN